MQGLSRLAVALVLSAVPFLSGCGGLWPPPSSDLIERGGIDILVEVPSDKTAMIKKHGHLERFCASRFADFAAGASVGVGLDAGYAGIEEGASVSSAVSELALGGRNPAVLIVRELMYRACEMTSNINASPEQTLAVYREFLQHADTITSSQQGAGSAVGAASSSAMTQVEGEDDDDDDY